MCVVNRYITLMKVLMSVSMNRGTLVTSDKICLFIMSTNDAAYHVGSMQHIM